MKIKVKFRVYNRASGEPLGLLTKEVESVAVPSSGSFFCYQDNCRPVLVGGADGSLYFYSDRVEFVGGLRLSTVGITSLVACGWDWKTWREIMSAEKEELS